MQLSHFYSRKWFQLIIVVVILYTFFKTLFLHRNIEHDARFTALNDFKIWSKYGKVQDIIDVVEILPNCGIPFLCPENTFPVHIYTGKHNKENSKLCIMGKYITNHASNSGRGLNIAVVNSRRLVLKDFVTFDVYLENSVVMDMWINASVKQYDIILIYTFDEASRMLAESSKKLFYDFGKLPTIRIFFLNSCSSFFLPFSL